MKKIEKKSAFTLIELSIVLLVLSFLISALLIGRRIIERARVQSVVNDVENIRRSYKLFIDTYGGVPGDLTSATCSKFSEFNTTECGTATNNGAESASHTYASTTVTSAGIKGDGLIQSALEEYYALRMMEDAGFLPVPDSLTAYAARGTLSASSSLASSTGNIGGNNTLYFFLSGVGSGYKQTATWTNINPAAFSAVGYVGLNHWLDRNFIAVTGINEWTAAFTIREAMNIKAKYDDATDPLAGNVALFGLSAPTGVLQTTENATKADVTCTALNAASVRQSASATFGTSTTYAQYRTAKAGCRAYFLLD